MEEFLNCKVLYRVYEELNYFSVFLRNFYVAECNEVVFWPDWCFQSQHTAQAHSLTINLYTDKNQLMVLSLKAEHING